MAPNPMPKNNIPLQPTPTAPGPWGPQQNYGSAQPHPNMHQNSSGGPRSPPGNYSPQMSPGGHQQQMGGPQGQYASRPNLPSNPSNQQGSYQGF
jgi:chitin synthase